MNKKTLLFKHTENTLQKGETVMSNKIIKYKSKKENFASYGLNKFKNFMQSPVCECGCGGSYSILLKNREELFGLMNNLLMDNDCDCCAIFAHAYDGNLYTAIKCISDEESSNEDDTPVKFFGAKDDYLDFFQEWDGEVGFHCYGLMIETEKGKWKVIEN